MSLAPRVLFSYKTEGRIITKMATIEAANTTPPGQIVMGCVVRTAMASGHITFYITAMT